MIRFTKTQVLILCPVGHLVEASSLKEWAGSSVAAEVAEYQAGLPNRLSRRIDQCSGYGHKVKAVVGKEG